MKVNGNISFIKKFKPLNISETGHVSRDPKHINNSNINPDDSKYNIYYNYSNQRSNGGNIHGSYKNMHQLVHKLDNQQWGKSLKKHNDSARKHHQPSRLKTMNEYLSGNKKHRFEYALGSLGSNARQKIDRKIKSKFPKVTNAVIKEMYSLALVEYASGYNGRNHCTRLLGFGTNVDEDKKYLGAAHVHFVLYNLGHTKTGKPSASLGRALANEYHMSNARKAMSYWHKKESIALLANVQNVMNQKFRGLNLKLEYAPTHATQTGLTMTEYKSKKVSQDMRENYARVYQKISQSRRQAHNLDTNNQNQQAINNSLVSQNQFLEAENGQLSKNRVALDSLMKTKHIQLSSLNNLSLGVSSYLSHSTRSYLNNFSSYENQVSSASSMAFSAFSSDYFGQTVSFNTSVSSVSSSLSLASFSNSQVTDSNAIALSSMNKTIQNNNSYVNYFESERKRIKKLQDQREKRQDKREMKQNQRDKDFWKIARSYSNKIIGTAESVVSSGFSAITSYAKIAPQKISSAVRSVKNSRINQSKVDAGFNDMMKQFSPKYKANSASESEVRSDAHDVVNAMNNAFKRNGMGVRKPSRSEQMNRNNGIQR